MTTKREVAIIPMTRKSRKAVQLNTIGVIADELRVPVHRVRYVLDSRPYIAPSAIAGRARLFDRQAVEQIRFELSRMDGRGRRPSTSN